MQLTIETYKDQSEPTSRVKREFTCDAVIIEPYGEGTTDKRDHPCITLSFADGQSAYACAHYINELPNSRQVDVFPFEDNNEKTWFIHFWYVPAQTTICIN